MPRVRDSFDVTALSDFLETRSLVTNRHGCFRVQINSLLLSSPTTKTILEAIYPSADICAFGIGEANDILPKQAYTVASDKGRILGAAFFSPRSFEAEVTEAAEMIHRVAEDATTRSVSDDLQKCKGFREGDFGESSNLPCLEENCETLEKERLWEMTESNARVAFQSRRAVGHSSSSSFPELSKRIEAAGMTDRSAYINFLPTRPFDTCIFP